MRVPRPLPLGGGGAPPQRVVIIAGAAAATGALVASAARIEGSLPLTPVAIVLGPLAAAMVAAGVASAGRRAAEWTPSKLLATIVVGAIGGLAGAGWHFLQPAAAGLRETGLPALLDGVHFLSGLVPAVLLAQPGVLLLGLLSGRIVEVVLTGAPMPALALLEIAVVAAPAEAWLLVRGRDATRSPGGLLVAGALLGGGAAAATAVFHPGAYPADMSLVALVRPLMSGLFAGWLVGRKLTTGLAAQLRSAPVHGVRQLL